MKLTALRERTAQQDLQETPSLVKVYATVETEAMGHDIVLTTSLPFAWVHLDS